MQDGGLPGWVTPAVIAVVFAVVSAAETLRPLRRRREPRLPHVVRNLATGFLALVATTALNLLVLVPLAAWVEETGVGLLHQVALPAWAEVVAAVLLLDYTLWVWHLLNHRVPFLWRFHLVHHVDRDLDASTALRFHFGEMSLSIGYRALQVAAFGPSALAVALWQALLFASILFHHGNVRLPIGLERRLVRFVVTPRMHGIHHSTVRAERNGNYASLLTAWDHVHRTLRLDVPQDRVRIGVPGHEGDDDVRFGRVNLLPFRRLEDEPAAERDALGAARPAAPLAP